MKIEYLLLWNELSFSLARVKFLIALSLFIQNNHMCFLVLMNIRDIFFFLFLKMIKFVGI
jgi:hypothetical protein